MNPYRRPFGLLANPVVVTLASLAALGGLLALLWSPLGEPEIHGGSPLVFFCAANVKKPMEKIVEAYQNEIGTPVQANFEGSGTLLSKLKVANAKVDLYLSADHDHMVQARKAGLVAETIPVATVRPVLAISPRTKKALADAGKPAVTGLKDILDREDIKAVLANPELTSIGQFTREVLQPLGLWDKLEGELKKSSPRVSQVGTVIEVASAIRLNEFTVGIVWDAVADQFGLEKIALPEFGERSETMWLGVTTRCKNPAAALRLARYITARDRGLSTLAKAGYKTPADADVWKTRPELKLSAGAMLMPAIADIVERFNQREGVSVTLTPAGCGILVSQMKRIKAGESSDSFPDVYFACDTSFLTPVEQWFDRPINVSKNDIVIIRRKGNPKGVTGLADLARADLRAGLCDPEKAALGELTERILVAEGLRDKVYVEGWQKRLVHVDAGHLLVTQMRAGALDIAVVYRSNVQASAASLERDLEMIELTGPRAVATQPLAIATQTQHKYLAERLRDALVNEANAAQFRKLGFHWQGKAP